ncbi:uncharacterized protein PgNI_08545 [Pyricularia grisea]|uniref:dual-specificity kinase n=1 Tax=Pyricularia grisea TaxID=148305 RepID=A0A6P8AWG2_PYRGI|nr:uncharacterized protein PgNI_08545 [Pyricularia grisea]TLD06527.1 hypothetical protein PgNI_08545 [Pyricularia grisea]
MHIECIICLAVARTGAPATFRITALESIGSKTFPSMDTVAATIDGITPLLFGALEYEVARHTHTTARPQATGKYSTVQQQQQQQQQLSWMSPASLDCSSTGPSRNLPELAYSIQRPLSFSYGEGFHGSSWLASSRTVPDEEQRKNEPKSRYRSLAIARTLRFSDAQRVVLQQPFLVFLWEEWLNENTTTSFDFLPSVNFDDLQSSLESASTDFKLTQFPSPTGQGSILEAHGMASTVPEKTNITQYGSSTRVAMSQPQSQGQNSSRIGTAGSIPRRPSNASTRSFAMPTSASTGSLANGPSIEGAPTAPAAMRARRQSHYPPVSNSNIAKPPRKSVGPGVLESEYGARNTARRRPSLTTNMPSTGRASIDEGARLIFGDPTRSTASSRASKAKSVGPPPRASQATLSPDTSINSEHFPVGGTVSRSPRFPGQNSAKRQSVIPGVVATGLGARTISPTDSRRMKRMSLKAPPTSTPQVPTVQAAVADARASSRSPSMLPRKTSTPSSSRTTPDPNRKSYSSGLSVNSVNSFNTVRTSTGSMQRPVQNGTSRLPAPKTLNVHNPANQEEEEDVPPVPAIPKAYESPKDSPAESSFLDKRKSTLAFDASSIHSTSTASLSTYPSLEQPGKASRRTSIRKVSHQNITLDLDKKGNVSQSKKNLQPLRLPPLTLGPLSTPTAAKIAALQEQGSAQSLSATPPPNRRTSKTPTTPMTASKSSFFSRHRHTDKAEGANLRSSSSIYNIRTESPGQAIDTNSTDSIKAINVRQPAQKPSVSPYLSSSLPKGGLESGGFTQQRRTKTGNGFSNGVDVTVGSSITQQRPSGPREPAASKPRAPKSPGPLSSPDEPPTPSSMSSLRRKLSLSWKRSASKASVLTNGDKTFDQHAAESMPPPRLPASSTMNQLTKKPPSPSSSSKPNGNSSYLESRRRKSSASSLNAIVAQDRVRSDIWGSKNESSQSNTSDRPPLSHSSSVMQKILKPRAAPNTNRRQDVWTADLDKDDLIAEEEMRKFGSRRKETELAAKTLDALRKRASPKERVSPQDAIRIAMLNIYERGEIVDYNDIYFCGTQNAAKVVGDLKSSIPNFGYDDERGDYSIVPGDHLAYRYEIIDVLGKGSFGQVVRCIDHKTGVLVAVKIIRNKKRFHQQALVEVNILQKLREWDPKNKHSMVNFTHSFYFRGHLCISTELLDMNLYEFIKANAFRGFSLKLIRRFTKQMLSSLSLLKQHRVIHCDLKPENILLHHPLHSEIKVIDFGSSCFENEKVYTYIQSRFYRSPEVILGMTYGMPIDMWSLGCILAELYTGVPIFPGENEQEQLACIMEVFGPPEKHLIEKSTRKKLFFDSMGKPRLTVSSKGRRRRPSSKTLQQVLKCDDEAFLDFLARCLRWDPDRRMKPEEAIRHEFISGIKASAPLPRLTARDGSPIKRHNTISTPRPLPEPPGGAGVKTGSNFARASPQKMITAGSRRTSNMSTASTVSAATKRVSTGTGTLMMGSSNLPRAAGRSASAKQDLAAAGATAAMNRRA